MSDKRSRSTLIVCSLMLLGAGCCQAVNVATVGDSFADSIYNAMRARPDFLRRYDVHLTRWSRPSIGLTRTDYFDYAKWLREANELGAVDICFVQIGSNDMQSIPFAKNQWIAYGSQQWKDAYASRTREMALTLTEHRCGQVIWLLQPGFEKQDPMACHRELINEVQRKVLRLDRTRVLELSTSATVYGNDKTHFNREFILELGPALFHLVDTSSRIRHAGCLTCHRSVEGIMPGSEIYPLRLPQNEVAVWAPDRIGLQCQTAMPKRASVRRVRQLARYRRGR